MIFPCSDTFQCLCLYKEKANSDDLFYSRPLKAHWDPHPTYHYTCIDDCLFLTVAGLINTLTDFCCTLLPAFVVIRLQMPLRQKLAVASVFLFGVVVNVASALRIYYSFVQTKSGDVSIKKKKKKKGSNTFLTF